MPVRVRGKYIVKGKELGNYSVSPIWLQSSTGFGWSHVVDERDVLLAHSFSYFMVSTISF